MNKHMLPDFAQAQVAVLGDIMLDRYWLGPTQRLSPEAPVPVVNVTEIEDRPGGAANVATNIAALGGNVQLIGLTGKDEAATVLKQQLLQSKVECNFVDLPTHPTITKLRVMSRHQQLLRLDFENSFADVEVTVLLQQLSKALQQAKILILSDYGKGTLACVQQMIQLAKQMQSPILIDPKGTDFKRYTGATLLTPNMSEFEAVVGHCINNADIIEKGMQLIDQLQLQALLITRSEQGMTLLQLNKAPLHLPTLAQEVFDVTGAGDTVIATLATALAAGVSLEEACFFANAAAGVVVGKLGTATLNAIELENAVRGRAHQGFGVMSENELMHEVELARQRGEKIVMTNGCFDILHAGHVSYLANARKLGDRLIVAVNSDASTRRLKGESRPVNPLEQRMIVLAALESVDWVVAFEEDTPQRVIAKVLPDILVKGGDYRPEQIAGGAEVIAAGGEVNIMNFEEGCSTSNIIRQIQQREY